MWSASKCTVEFWPNPNPSHVGELGIQWIWGVSTVQVTSRIRRLDRHRGGTSWVFWAKSTAPVLDLPEQDGLSLGWKVAWSVEVAVRWVGSRGGSGGVATPERRRRRQGR